MAETYANSVDNIRRTVAQTKGDEAQSLDVLNDKVKQNYSDALDNFKEKWQGVEQIGGAVEGVAPVFRAGRSLYGRYRDASQPTEETPGPTKSVVAPDEDALPFPEVDAPIAAARPVGTGSIASLPQPAPRGIKLPAPRTKTIIEKPTSITEEDLAADPFQTYSGGKTLSSSFTRISKPSENSLSTADDLATQTSANVKSSVTSALDDVGTDAVAEAGSDLGSFFTADAVASAIPVVGEAAAAIGGLVAIGTGIGELFSHKTQTPQIRPTAISLPTQLTSKYSDSIPSVDGTIQRAASSSVF